jgi:hypothetical protein
MFLLLRYSRLVGCAKFPSVEPEMTQDQEEAVCKFLQHGQTKGPMGPCCLDLTDDSQTRSTGGFDALMYLFVFFLCV